MAARLSNLIALGAWAITILLLVPFSLELPIATLDASWKYGLNEAIAKHLVFGRDLIFSFGPLAPVYTRMYHPGTNAIMIGFGLLFAVALATGCVWLCAGRRFYLLLWLPIFLTQILLFDAAFLVLPFVFLLLVTQWSSKETERRKPTLAVIALAGTAVSVLPLVKGSFSGPVLFCGGFAWILIARQSRFLAGVAVLWAAAAIAIAWVITGQPIGALPGYFLTQSQIVAGYTEAMSLKGPMLQVIVFVTAAVSIGKTFAAEATARFGKTAIPATLGLALTLFVAFKAGFVRHDVHALIAASSLLMVAYLGLLIFQSRRVAKGMLVAFLVWIYITLGQSDMRFNSSFSRMTGAVRNSVSGLIAQISDKGAIQQKFDASIADVRGNQGLPSFDGTADIYPTNVLAILVNGQKWSPRPILQSYSAYTPELLELNRQHLGTAASADRIYFSIAPIDGHYPSTEDGASWPEVMSRYGVRSFAAPFAVLDRRPTPLAVKTDKVLYESRNGKLGTAISVPESRFPIWATVDIGPSWFGSVYEAIFKLPPLRLTVVYEDGTTSQFRFIPGVAKSGFLLSPTVKSAEEFAALQRPQREEHSMGRRLDSMEVTTKLWIQRLFWKGRYEIRLSELDVPADENIPPYPR